MARRFDELEESDLEDLINSRDSKNTSKLIKASLSVLENYVTEKGMDFSEIEHQAADQLNCFLRKFYAEMKKVDGKRYAKKSMISMRYGLQKHFLKVRKEDIINDERFKAANEMFKAVLVNLKKSGAGEPKSKDPLTQEDMNKLYETVFNLEDPENLQKKTMFECIYYFCNRGLENLRELQRDDFIVATDSAGREYVTVRERQTKNHRVDDLQDMTSKQGRMYDKPVILVVR